MENITLDSNLISRIIEINLTPICFEKHYTGRKKIKCLTSEGYIVLISISDVGKKNPLRFSKSNPYTIENIKHWLILNNKTIELCENQYYINSVEKLQWKCSKCDSNFNKSWIEINNCPFCSGDSVNDTNSITSLRPELVKYFKNKNEADTLTVNSNKTVNLICPNCKEKKVMNVQTFTKQGFSCSVCSDGISIPEKFGRNLFKQLKINFKTEKRFEWSNNKYYDFYIESFEKYMVEVHGLQHYEETSRGRTLQEEQENDLLKYNLAIENGIKPENYIVVDCRYSEFEWLKENYIKSLSNHFNLSDVDWHSIWLNCQNSLCIECCNLWNMNYSVLEILKLLNISKSTVIRYLKIGSDISLCHYDAKNEMIKNAKRNGDLKKKPIYQYSKDGVFFKKWDTQKEAADFYNLKVSRLSDCCYGRRKSAKGYIWTIEPREV